MLFIESALSKDPDDRISNWERIREILKPRAGKYQLPLEPDELAVVIRFGNTSYQKSARFINAMKKLLQDKGVDHQMEVQRGVSDDS